MAYLQNKNIQSEGFHFGTQTPVDDRLIFADNADLIDLGVGNSNAYKYYEGMVVTQVDALKTFIWAEATLGALATSFTYPAGHIVNGVDYSGRSFNFVDITSSANIGVGDIYFVGNDGDDTTAVKGNTTRAWQSIVAAKDVAVASGASNTLIYVFPGSYQEVGLAYEGGTYYFAPGAFVQTNLVLHANRNDNHIFRSDSASGDTIVNFSVYGEGDFFANASTDGPDTGGGVYFVDQAGFDGDFMFNSIISEYDTGIGVFNIDRATIRGEYIYTMAGSYCITIRGTGSIEIEVDRIRSGGSSAVYVRHSAVKYTGNLHLRTKYIYVTSATAALDFQQVISPAQITIDAMHIECTNSGSQVVKSVQQEGGTININIQKMETAGSGIYSYKNTIGGDFNVNIDQGNCDVGGEGAVVIRECARNHRTYVNAKRMVSAHPTATVSLTQGNTSNTLKLDGTFINTDPSAAVIDMSSTDNGSYIVFGTATLITSGGESMKNSHSDAKEVFINNSLSANSAPVANKFNFVISGTPFIVDTNILR